MTHGWCSLLPPARDDSLDLEDPELRQLLHLWIRRIAVLAAPLRELEAYVIYSINLGVDPAWARAYPLDLDCVGSAVCLIHRQAWFTFCGRVRAALDGGLACSGPRQRRKPAQEATAGMARSPRRPDSHNSRSRSDAATRDLLDGSTPGHPPRRTDRAGRRHRLFPRTPTPAPGSPRGDRRAPGRNSGRAGAGRRPGHRIPAAPRLPALAPAAVAPTPLLVLTSDGGAGRSSRRQRHKSLSDPGGPQGHKTRRASR